MYARSVLPALAAGLLSLSSAFASLDPPGTNVARSKIEIGPWTFNPICTVDEHGGVIVQSMLAIADPSFTIGDNIVSVWYYRDGEDWASKAWTSQDPWEAIKALKLELGIPDEQDERWSAADWSAPGQGVGDPEPPSDYLKGLLADDPFAALVIASPDGDLLVTLLASVGYKAADLPIDKNDNCTTVERLNVLAEFSKDMYLDDDVSYLILPVDHDLCDDHTNIAIGPIGPPPTKPNKPTWAPPWSPAPVVPTVPPWFTGGPPATWECRTVPLFGGGTNCICSRRIQWGRWETNPRGSIRWRRFIETETCTDINVPCPAAGPPSAGSNCTSTYRERGRWW